MIDEPAEPRVLRGGFLHEAVREDLELYAVSDLEERIVALEGEIARCRAMMDHKRSGRAAADALFFKT